MFFGYRTPRGPPALQRYSNPPVRYQSTAHVTPVQPPNLRAEFEVCLRFPVFPSFGSNYVFDPKYFSGAPLGPEPTPDSAKNGLTNMVHLRGKVNPFPPTMLGEPRAPNMVAEVVESKSRNFWGIKIEAKIRNPKILMKDVWIKDDKNNSGRSTPASWHILHILLGMLFNFIQRCDVRLWGSPNKRSRVNTKNGQRNPREEESLKKV